MKLLAVLLVISLAALADAWYRPYGGYGGWGGYGGYRGGWGGGWGGYGGYRGGWYRPFGRSLESLKSSEKSSERVARYYGYPYLGYGGYGLYGGYGYGYFKRMAQAPQDSFEMNAVHCALSRNDSMISCRSPSTIIECPIVLNMTGISHRFEFFGLSRIAGMNYSTVEPLAQKFWLFPRSVDNSRWLNYSQQIMGSDRMRSLKIFYGEVDRGCAGIRVMDRECFTDISRLFCSIEHRLRVAIEGDSNRMCDFFGDVMIV